MVDGDGVIFLPPSIAEGRKGFGQEKRALSDGILGLRGCGVHYREGRLEGNHHPGTPCFDLRDPAFVDAGAAGPITNCVTTQDQAQGRLLEEAKRDLEAFKNAYYRAERDMRDLEGRFEKEKQELNEEIRWLRECSTHCHEERFEGNHHPDA